MKRVLPWVVALGVLAGYGPSWAQEREGEKKQEEGEKPAAKREGDRQEGERPAPAKREGERREGDKPAVKREGERQEGDKPAVRREGERKEGDRPAPAKREGVEGDRKEGDRPAPVKREGEGDRREGEKPAVRRDGDRKEGGERPAVRDGERREGDRPVVRDGDRREGGERPAVREGERREGERPVLRDGERKEGERPVRRDGDPKPERENAAREKPAPAEPPIALDDRVVSKNEAQPSLVGRVQSVFKDGGNTLLTLRVPGRSPAEVSIQVQAATSVSYYGLEKTQEQPTAGYVAYVWLKADSKDVASGVRFTAEKK